MTPATTGVLLELAVERDRQTETGRDAGDDDKPMDHWAWLLQLRAVTMAHPFERDNADLMRRQLIEVAAIAVAAIESIDRRTHVRGRDGDAAPEVVDVAGEAPPG